jgi:hypothetical protein
MVCAALGVLGFGLFEGTFGILVGTSFMSISAAICLHVLLYWKTLKTSKGRARKSRWETNRDNLVYYRSFLQNTEQQRKYVFEEIHSVVETKAALKVKGKIQCDGSPDIQAVVIPNYFKGLAEHLRNRIKENQPS